MPARRQQRWTSSVKLCQCNICWTLCVFKWGLARFAVSPAKDVASPGCTEKDYIVLLWTNSMVWILLVATVLTHMTTRRRPRGGAAIVYDTILYYNIVQYIIVHYNILYYCTVYHTVQLCYMVWYMLHYSIYYNMCYTYISLYIYIYICLYIFTHIHTLWGYSTLHYAIAMCHPARRGGAAGADAPAALLPGCAGEGQW